MPTVALRLSEPLLVELDALVAAHGRSERGRSEIVRSLIEAALVRHSSQPDRLQLTAREKELLVTYAPVVRQLVDTIGRLARTAGEVSPAAGLALLREAVDDLTRARDNQANLVVRLRETQGPRPTAGMFG